MSNLSKVQGVYGDDECMARLGRRMVNDYIDQSRQLGEPNGLTCWPLQAQQTIIQSGAINKDGDDLGEG